MLAIQFVNALRARQFDFHLETIEQLMPLINALDHHLYARTLPIYLRDMCTLEERHPAIHKEFMEGNFVGQKSKRSGSTIALDQTYEQLINVLKGDGGIIGLSEDPSSLRLHQVAGPELARLVAQFEEYYTDSSESSSSCNHHEQYPEFQKSFKNDVDGMISALESLATPFTEDSGELFSLDTSVIMSETVVKNVANLTTRGRKQYEKFFNERVS